LSSDKTRSNLNIVLDGQWKIHERGSVFNNKDHSLAYIVWHDQIIRTYREKKSVLQTETSITYSEVTTDVGFMKVNAIFSPSVFGSRKFQMRT
jgi:hypothetical protein